MLDINFEELIGKEFDYQMYHETVRAVVAQADGDIGITVVNKNKPDEKLMCMVGPTGWKAMNKNNEDPWTEKDQIEYENSWNEIVAIINLGYYNVTRSTMGRTESVIPSDACPFNQ